nr:hypothetical protein [uncultured Pseudomonas sp.]
MNTRSTSSRIATAQEQITGVYKAPDLVELKRQATWARAWFMCLHYERLIDAQEYGELNTELNDAVDEMIIRVGNLSPVALIRHKLRMRREM